MERHAFVFLYAVDVFGHDIKRIAFANDETTLAEVAANALALSVNTLGFVKTTAAGPYVRSRWFGAMDGIFVLRTAYETFMLQNVGGTPSAPPSRIKAVILTLPDMPAARRASLETLHAFMLSTGVPTEVVLGCCGKDIEFTTHSAAAAIQVLSHTGRTRTYSATRNMKVGELGCAWSHLNLYERLVEDAEFDTYLVLEDDVVPQTTPAVLLHHLGALPDDMDVALLQHSDFYPFERTGTCKNEAFSRIKMQYFNGTNAYCVRKRGAAALLEFSGSGIYMPADDLLSNAHLAGCVTTCVPTAHQLFYEPKGTVSCIHAMH